MAAGRRSQEADREYEELKQKISQIDEIKQKVDKIDEVSERMVGLSTMVSSLCQRIQQSTPGQSAGHDSGNHAENSSRGSLHNQNPDGLGNNHQILPRTTKIDFPRFDGGDDPTSWVYRAEQFFALNRTPEDAKVPIASYHLEHEAIQWYQWFERTIGLPTWADFCTNLLARFGPSSFEDFTGALTKLTQTRTVRDYQTQFEKLANRTRGLTEEFFVSCFISGLKEDIQAEVRMFKPSTLCEALGIAKLAEDKFAAQ